MSQHESMDAATRQKVFWLLQRLTSFTLWERKRGLWERFARAYAEAVQTWPADQHEQVPADNLASIYKISSLYSEGLAELQRGHRFVWRRGGAFHTAIREYRVVATYLYPDGDYWERGMQQAPYPPKVEALNQLMRASEFHGETAPLELSGREDGTARISSANWLLSHESYEYGFHALAYPVFADVLPKVPDATNVVIRSGEKVPASGIWEPVSVRRDRVFGLIPHGNAEVSNNGCFNYFVDGIDAPKIIGDYNERTERFERVGINWRLIWEDSRYKDGVIPDESEYFIESKPIVAPREDGASREYRTHEICPVSGVWQAVGYKNPPIHIAAGAVMPDLSVRDIKGEMVLHYVKWQLVQRD